MKQNEIGRVPVASALPVFKGTDAGDLGVVIADDPALVPDQWCALLYPDPVGVINVFSQDASGRKYFDWASCPKEFGEVVAAIGNERNVWFGCATRKERLLGNQRGGADDCLELAGLWVDIDVKGDAHAEDALPPTFDDAHALLGDFALRPTVVVHSGNGLQAWWLFPHGESVDAQWARTELLPGWKATWTELFRRRGWKVDAVFDLPRVMRIPGTRNIKTDPPKPVTVLTCDEDRRYEAEELAEHFIAAVDNVSTPAPKADLAPLGPGVTPSTIDQYNAEVDPGDLLEAAGCELRHTTNGSRHYHVPGSVNETGVTVYADNNKAHIFSASFAAANGLEQNCSYDAFGLFMRMHHGGDASAAVRALDQRSTGDVSDLIAHDHPQDGGDGRKSSSPLLVARSFRDVEAVRARWLWDGRIPVGSLTLLAGREGEGKSTVAIDVMAQLSRGELNGEFFGTPRVALIVATEDSAEHTIKPRLMAAGANLDRVFSVAMAEPTGVLTLPMHIADLAELCQLLDPALIVLDPLLSRLSGKLDSHKDADVRQALEPLGAFASDTGIAVLGLIHLNKSGGTDPLRSIMGSVAFTAFARSVLVAMVDPDDEQRRLLGLAKSNLGRLDVPTLTYTFDAVEVGEDHGPIIATRIAWGDQSSTSIRDAFQVGPEDRNAIEEAAEWLRDWLDYEGGSGLASTAMREGKKAGHSDSTIKRARTKLGIQTRREGFPAQVIWYWPGLTGGLTEVKGELSDLVTCLDPAALKEGHHDAERSIEVKSTSPEELISLDASHM